MTAWVVTLPRDVEWTEGVAEADGEVRFRVPPQTRSIRSGDRCYVTWRGAVRAWFAVKRVEWRTVSWWCSQTRTVWSPGVYIVCAAGAVVVPERPLRGFQGVRRYTTEEGQQ